MCRGDLRLKLNVSSKIELVGKEVDVGKDLRLAGEVLRPVPLVEYFLAEAELVRVALRVETSARI